jgi:sigma-E factor negative regulatory protein RseA
MTDSVKEQLSACLDGELSRQDLLFLAKRLGHDSESRATLSRYALAAEALRTGKPVALSANFADRVMERIQAEGAAGDEGAVPEAALVQQALPSSTQRAPRFLKPVAGFAIAASVAAVALFSVQRAGLFESAPEVADTAAFSAPVVAANVDSVDRYVVPQSQSSATAPAFIPATRLTNYVVAHSEYSSPLGRQRVVSGMLAEGEADGSFDEDFVDLTDEAAVIFTEEVQR